MNNFISTASLHILEIHSQTLKHDVDIPDNLGTGQAVFGGSRQ